MVSATATAEKLKMNECQNKTKDEKRYPDFICPICGSGEYKEEYKGNEIAGPGGKRWRVHYVCAGCSVMFIDPGKFSKNRA